MTIRENGKVGIGTSSPGYNLDVPGSGRFKSLTIRNTGSQFDDVYMDLNGRGKLAYIGSDNIKRFSLMGSSGKYPDPWS